MPRYMGIHTFPRNAFTSDQVCQLAKAAQNDPGVKGYRSFLNLSQGKAVCIMEAPTQQAVMDWFKRMNMPTDLVMEVEMEGHCGEMESLREMATA